MTRTAAEFACSLSVAVCSGLLLRTIVPEFRRSVVIAAAVAVLACSSVAHAAMVSQTIFFNIPGFSQTQGTPFNQPLPTASVSGGVAFTYDDSIITLQQDSTANNPSVFVDAVSLTINNAQPGGTPRTYTVSEVMISLRVDTATFSLKDTLGAMHGGEPNTDGFNFLFLPFNDLVNIEYLFGNYSVSTGGSGVWFSAIGTASTVLGNQITPIPLPAPLAAFLCCGAVVGIRRRR